MCNIFYCWEWKKRFNSILNVSRFSLCSLLCSGGYWNTSLDEIKALLNGKFDEFSEKLASIKEKFDKTTKDIYLKLDKIEKDTEESRIKSRKNSDEIEVWNFR